MNILYIIKENINNEVDINYAETADNEQTEYEQTQKTVDVRKEPNKNNEQYKFGQIDAVLKKLPDTLQDIINSHSKDGNQIYIALLNYKKYNLTDRQPGNPQIENINVKDVKDVNTNINPIDTKNAKNTDMSGHYNKIENDVLLLELIKTYKTVKSITYDELIKLIFFSDKIICW
jgi:hypothetical protein